MRLEARNVFIGDTTLPEIVELSIADALQFFQELKLDGQRGQIADKVMKEINDRLHFLVNVGLNYLNLSRSAETLSGGEAQRIRLATQIGAQLTGVLPSVGFGYEEVGSITGEPCAGNSGTRLWRLKKSKGLVVYYGLKNNGAEILSNNHIPFVKIAETQKYPHVTYFFNGTREEPYAYEERIMVPSKKVKQLYDEKPEMSASEITDAVVPQTDNPFFLKKLTGD